ncbi:MAG: hypothetical protein IPI77_24000 [Saprospiraceae bacterium]|nr:hypothetical protein [Saprospiraceae bacterium]
MKSQISILKIPPWYKMDQSIESRYACTSSESMINSFLYAGEKKALLIEKNHPLNL